MLLGLRCSCGHELDFNPNILKLFIETNLEQMVIVCRLCEREVFVKREGEILTAHRVWSKSKVDNMGKWEYDSEPTSSCLIPH